MAVGYFAAMSESPAQPGWIHRHSRSVRICHWVNVIAVAYLVISGVHIFLDFPELYWGKVGFQGHPAAFRLADWGLSWERAGELGDRRWGRNYHYLYAWVFVINGFIYVGWNLWRRHFRSNVLPARDDLSGARIGAELRDRFRLRQSAHEAGQYSALQKISYSALIFVVVPSLILTGLAQMPAFTAIAPWMIDLMGGRQTARTLHVLGMLVLLLFLVVHVVEVFMTGFLNQVRAMITGRYRLVAEEDR